MTPEKVLEAIDVYRKFFEKNKIGKCTSTRHDIHFTLEDQLKHCHGMLDQMEKFVLDGRMDKVFRWLGFIQGCLWSQNQYTLEELKNHNRP
jgi:hypothetical protein